MSAEMSLASLSAISQGARCQGGNGTLLGLAAQARTRLHLPCQTRKPWDEVLQLVAYYWSTWSLLLTLQIVERGHQPICDSGQKETPGIHSASMPASEVGLCEFAKKTKTSREVSQVQRNGVRLHPKGLMDPLPFFGFP